MRNRLLVALAVLPLAACANAARVDTIVGLTGDSTDGAVVYADNCASCHGADATGGTERGITGAPDEEVAEVVLNGEESMPSFADTLSDQDIADVIAWLAEQG
jgi:mono/diheme cytochrome c family protein